VISFKPHPVYSWRKELWYLLDRRLGGPQSQSGYYGESNSLVPAKNQILIPWPSSPVAIKHVKIILKKVKLSLWLINLAPCHGDVWGWGYSSTTLDLSTRGRCVVSFMIQLLYFQGKAPSVPIG
jgi:hypothetical protein